jgi:Cu(I)/Ag(I) efflux system periplasmic protein CusF
MQMLRRIKVMGFAVLAGTFVSIAWAQSTGHGAHAPAPAATKPASAAPAPMTDGEVRKIDKGAAKITLKHGPIPNLDMPDMTMVFRASEPAMLDGLKVGDKVRFAADKVGGQYTVVRIEPAK